MANQRADFIHKLTHKLTVENQAVCLESLAVKNMLANHCLAKSIADAAWGEFARQMQYKGKWYGCAIGEIHRFFPSSKLHNKCGFINSRRGDCRFQAAEEAPLLLSRMNIPYLTVSRICAILEP